MDIPICCSKAENLVEKWNKERVGVGGCWLDYCSKARPGGKNCKESNQRCTKHVANGAQEFDALVGHSDTKRRSGSIRDGTAAEKE